MRVFVTVGTTKFDSLIKAIIHPEVQDSLAEKSYKEIVVQRGKSKIDISQSGLRLKLVEQYDYKPSLADDISSADLVIGHAGAGTCLEVLGANKPLVVVVNEDLMNNHQAELADCLARGGHLWSCTCSTIASTLQTLSDPVDRVAFPAGDLEAFATHIDSLFAD